MKRTPLRRTTPLLRKQTTPTATVHHKDCQQCGKPFFPARPMQAVCSARCARRLVAAKAKAEREQDRAKREALRPIGYWEKKAEKAVNRYARARDFRYGCISCHLPANWDGQWHASHLRSVAAASAVRFHLWNIHKACWICNKLYSGRIDAYRPQAEARIGADKVNWLYTQNQAVRFSRDYLERLAAVFNKKAARQERRNAMQG